MINRVDRMRVSVNDDDASPKHAAVAQSGLAQKKPSIGLAHDMWTLERHRTVSSSWCAAIQIPSTADAGA